MNVAIIVAIITGLLTIVNGFITYKITKYNFRERKLNSILEKQYESVFAPLHKVIFYERGLTQVEAYNYISTIISVNYMFVPPEILDAIANEDEALYKRLITKAYEGARSHLGYTQFKRNLDEETLEMLGGFNLRKTLIDIIMSIARF